MDHEIPLEPPFVNNYPYGGLLHRVDVQSQHDELSELPCAEVVVADDDQHLPSIREGRAKCHPLYVVDRDAKIVECEHLPL